MPVLSLGPLRTELGLPPQTRAPESSGPLLKQSLSHSLLGSPTPFSKPRLLFQTFSTMLTDPSLAPLPAPHPAPSLNLNCLSSSPGRKQGWQV